MQFTYELTEEDFIEAYRAHRERSAFNKWSTKIVFWFVILLGAAGIVVSALARDLRPVKMVVPLVILALVWKLVFTVLPRWNMRRQFRKQPGAQGVKTISFESDGLHFSSENGSGVSAWKNYVRWAEGKNQVLLYNSPYYYIVVSTSTLAPAQRAELLAMLKEKIGK